MPAAERSEQTVVRDTFHVPPASRALPNRCAVVPDAVSEYETVAVTDDVKVTRDTWACRPLVNWANDPVVARLKASITPVGSSM